MNEDARFAMMIRLNMLEMVGRNYGKNDNCPLCSEHEDNTEHVLECKELPNTEMVTIKDLEDGSNMKSIVNLFRRTEEKRRNTLIDDITLKFNIIHSEKWKTTVYNHTSIEKLLQL